MASILPAATGSLTVNVDPPGGAGGSVTAGYLGTTVRTIDQKYSITATPKTTPAPGFVFERWIINSAHTVGDIGVTTVALEKPALTFTMKDGLNLTAKFVPNPFAAVAGSYTGLIRPSTTAPDVAPPGAGPEDGTASAIHTEGIFTATVQSTGAFSGKLTIDGSDLSFSGVFDTTGVARFGTNRTTTGNVLRTNKPDLIVALLLNLTAPTPPPGPFPPDTEKITGTVTQKYRTVTTAVSDIDADRAHYSSTVPLDPDYMNSPTATTGTYTAIFKARTSGQPAALTTDDYPQGHGFANVTISKTGTMTFAGVLADNTALSASRPISKDNRCPIFAQLYSKKGFVSALVQLDKTLVDSHFSAPEMRWSRPFQDVQHYPYGWEEVITTDLLGSKYAATNLQSVLSPFPPGNPSGTADLDFTEGNLAGPVNLDVGLSVADAVTRLTPPTTAYSLTITRSNGRFSGSFTHTDSTKPTFSGIIYQRPGSTFHGGYGFFLTKTPTVKDYTGESGAVSLKPQP